MRNRPSYRGIVRSVFPSSALAMHLLPVGQRGNPMENGAEAGVGLDRLVLEQIEASRVYMSSGGAVFGMYMLQLCPRVASPKRAQKCIPYGQSPLFFVSCPPAFAVYLLPVRGQRRSRGAGFDSRIHEEKNFKQDASPKYEKPCTIQVKGSTLWSLTSKASCSSISKTGVYHIVYHTGTTRSWFPPFRVSCGHHPHSSPVLRRALCSYFPYVSVGRPYRTVQKRARGLTAASPLTAASAPPRVSPSSPQARKRDVITLRLLCRVTDHMLRTTD